MFKNPGVKWPIIIAVSIVGIIGACVWTIKVAINNPVEMSEYGMQSYHEYDRDVNDIIEAKIAFDQKYSISFVTPQITAKGTVVEYNLTDKSGRAVNNGQIDVVLTRPNENKYDINLSNPTVVEGRYIFAPVDLPKLGRWDIMAKVSVGSDQRYYNLKADTRNPNTFEF
ncbi:FixH family protein [Sulfuricurvum sp.]|uniref:FixH family protein n=1 Tax=Sulfuricurvum sp. TaxID=2025608 RepID=UPI00198DC276|nr:FixH family protein [Sulfuricurvum sp.]MBD3806996.1 FixH family protein [Sulfuricurvum sp.]